MSISIDTDLSALATKLHISPERMSLYGNKSVQDIAEAEAASGNAQAAQVLMQMISDPDQLVKLFKLSDASNRYAILKNLSEKDLKGLLPLLEKEDLAAGLNFFTKDKLLDLVEQLPKDQLVKYVSQMFSKEQIMKLMPEKEMDKLLQSQDLDKNLVLKHLKDIPPAVLSQMLEAATGQQAMGQQAGADQQSDSSSGQSNDQTQAMAASAAMANSGAMAASSSANMQSFDTTSSGNSGSGIGSPEQTDLINKISQLSPSQYKDALTSMPEDMKRGFIHSMGKDDPKIYELFSASAYTGLLKQKEKPDLVKSATALEPEQLMKMIKELPKDLMAVVATQIDPAKFADVLASKYQDVLKKVVLS